LPVPIILHVHELEYLIDVFVGHEYFFNHIISIDHFIAVSDVVKEELIQNYKIDETKISIVYPSSPNLISPNKKKADVLAELNIDEKSFIVGAAGTGSWVKGHDIFINLAYCFFKKYPESICIFMWVGKISDSDYKKIRYDLNKTGLTEKVKFIGEKINPVDYYNIFDIFTLVSRIESFSLVCLENAFLSKPLICFDNIGYIPKFVENDAGFIIPYLDIECMASKIHLLYKDKNLRTRLGNKARDKYLEKFDFEFSFRKIINCIDNLISL
jgi:glycosyltransferase involved in cell wall biosynthesis